MRFKSIRNLLLLLLATFSISSFADQVTDITAAQLLADDSQGRLILDVRSAEEFAAGHVPNAVNIPHDEIEGNIEQLINYQDKSVVVYCRSGRRAAIAENILLEHGFSNVMHLQGDMLGWQESKYPVEK
ncbi:rhodanese-like domain-containing protein [Aliiglaciecola litoralis]|uniref:Rhodanese-like domain-containing protein n=1 Tax=Aliiglaciecola litoralis TaxID=582857 RepID=A0ABP3X290_9ALTE